MSIFVDDDRIMYDSDEKRDNLENNMSSRINNDGEPPTATMEAEKRIRREIANSNERRRMQSINNGFQSLRSLLPRHEGEKLSKAAILQQTAEYIYTLEQEKTRLLSQNSQLKRLVSQHESQAHNNGELPPKKRKAEIIPLSKVTQQVESSDEGLGSMSPEPVGIIVVNEPSSTTELRRLLDQERQTRHLLEEQMRQIEGQMYQQTTASQPQIYQVETEEIALQLVTAESLPPVGHTQTVVCSPQRSRSPSPEPEERLPSVLEAAIKAEPKVEVERLPSPTPEDAAPARLYVSNTSRQNLETIVEAIRHLEGDHMFAEEPPKSAGVQEAPLALTTKSSTAATATLMEFSAAMVQQSQQSRPGVIVVKQAAAS